MKAKKYMALLTALLLLLTLSGCLSQAVKNAPRRGWGVIQRKFDDVMGFSQIGEELDTLKTGTAAGIKADKKSKGTVDLSDSEKNADTAVDGIAVPEGKPEDSGNKSSGGFLSGLFDGFSGKGSPSLPDYSFYCEISNGFKDDIYGYSPTILYKVWYLEGKFKVTTEFLRKDMLDFYKASGVDMPKEGTVYFTVDSPEGFAEIMGNSTPAEAKKAVENFKEIDSETVNGYDCAVYKGTSQKMGSDTGNLYYWIYNYNSSPVVMAYIFRPVENGVENGFGSAEYRYTFGGITASDVTPASGTATHLG